ncbi:MAG: ATP-binding protein [Myxococcota bacterium]
MRVEDYEKLGAFYLGRPVDAETGEDRPEPFLYDSKDLTTHAMIVGMTGSGKTGLGIGLLEEALIDGVPVIAIDPKGDLGNMLLTFPKLAAKDFRPWVDEGAAARAGETPDDFAASQAKLWKDGLASWGQSPDRIKRLEASAERVLYTPGSNAGTPLSILRSLDAPPAALLEDDEALRERILSSVSGLLGLIGLNVDPIQSREHILLSTLVERAWREGRNLDMASLIHQIQKPPVERIGIMELETFFPADDRFGLAMRLNNLLASPGFAAWLEGEPLDIGHMLRAPDGRPRLSVVSIAHLSDSERMFVVTLLLGQLVSWMRTQSGSQSLRAILYMDEIFGYFPPTANPPSKTPMLTLLKQARAYGVGCVLSTQNPVDLDYKGLSNCGTWFLGRLQTERDKARVMDGLESSTSGAGAMLDRAALEKTLSGLDSRVFLMNNVHEDKPALVRSRWVMSYLAGPLSRAQIKKLAKAPKSVGGPDTATRLAAAHKAAAPDKATIKAALAETPAEAADKSTAASTAKATPAKNRPVIPAEAKERFLPATGTVSGSERLVYRPALLASVSTHYGNARAGVDEWTKHHVWAPLNADLEGSPWDGARLIGALPELEKRADERGGFGALPSAAERKTSYTKWAKQLKTLVYRDHPLMLWKSKKPKLISEIGEEEGAFRGRLSDLVHEERDLKLEKLRKKYAPKLARLQDRIERAEQKVEKEEEQYKDRKAQTAVSFGATVMGALFGRKLGSVGNVGRAASAIKGVSRSAREKADIGRAEERVADYQEQLGELEEQFQADLDATEDAAADFELDVEELRINAKKTDLDVERLYLVWIPARIGADGSAEALAEIES